MPNTLKDWFCLKEDRDNFKLKVKRDSHFIFCNEKEINDNVMRSIEMRYAANEPVKMLIYGDWGIGKTHAANHIRWWLEQNKYEYPAKTVMIEIGDIDKKSKFDALVRPFLDELGVDYLVQLSREYDSKTGGIVPALCASGVSQYISTVFSKFLMAAPGTTPPPVVQDAFSILRGRRPPAGGANMGLGEQLAESNDFFGVLHAIGEMHRHIHGHRIIFIADEAAKLEDVENDEATCAHWIAVNRAIFDDQNDVFGFIYTVSGKTTSRMPRAIYDPQIENRLGKHNTFYLENLVAQDVEMYLSRLFEEIVNKECVLTLVEKGEFSGLDFDISTYPFTPDGKQRFMEFWQVNLQDAKPRDISDKLNSVGFVALKLGQRLITPECLEKANM